MRSSVKGALLSGLVYPGLGQIVQRHYIRGVIMIVMTSWCLYQILLKVLRQVMGLLEGISGAEIAISTDDIVGLIIELMPDVKGPSYGFLILVLVVCWLASVTDAFLAGKSIEADENQSAPDLTDSIEIE